MWWVFSSCEYARNANLVPVRLVCGGITVANADCAYDPVPVVCRLFKVAPPAADGDDIVGDGGGSLVAVFAAGVSYLQLQALPLSYFPWLIAILAGYMTLTQLVKGFHSRRYGWQ